MNTKFKRISSAAFIDEENEVFKKDLKIKRKQRWKKIIILQIKAMTPLTEQK